MTKPNERKPMHFADNSRPPILQISHVSRNFGGVWAVRDCSFIVTQGITGLIGPNGAGKSTLVNMLAGLVKPSGGTILLDGTDITKMPVHQRASLGLRRTFQLPRQFSSMSVVENVLFASRRTDMSLTGALFRRRQMKCRDNTAHDDAMEVLGSIGLASKANDYSQTLSGGQMRLLEIARALISKPRVLLLDEPTAGISPVMQDTVAAKLTEIAHTGTTILLVEHNLRVVDNLCDTVVVMASGSVLAEGSLADHRRNVEVVEAYLGVAGA